MAGWYTTVVKEDMGGKSEDALAKETDSWIDVRDLALAHVLALEKEAAGGERIIISAGTDIQCWRPRRERCTDIHIDHNRSLRVARVA